MIKVFSSKTVWFNIITAVCLVFALPEFISVLPATAIPYITLAGAIGNMILRIFYTKKPTTLTVKK